MALNNWLLFTWLSFWSSTQITSAYLEVEREATYLTATGLLQGVLSICIFHCASCSKLWGSIPIRCQCALPLLMLCILGWRQVCSFPTSVSSQLQKSSYCRGAEDCSEEGLESRLWNKHMHNTSQRTPASVGEVTSLSLSSGSPHALYCWQSLSTSDKSRTFKAVISKSLENNETTVPETSNWDFSDDEKLKENVNRTFCIELLCNSFLSFPQKPFITNCNCFWLVVLFCFYFSTFLSLFPS